MTLLRQAMAGLRVNLSNPARLALMVFVLSLTAFPEQPDSAPVDLADKSLEDLMNIQVTSVSKKEQTLSRTASAIFVISATDIQRSGATNIPDLLRMVPGVDVAQIDANTWAVSVRGLNARFGNELLVVLDGRNVYTPTFGGVLWDTLDLPLEDIERIEVIRGPGGTIWGANAVNGVINIITRKAAETSGTMLVAGGGNLDQGSGTAQYGGKLGHATDYRIYTKYFNQDHLPGLAGGAGFDGWHLLRGGFRTDSSLSSKDSLSLQGDVYTGSEDGTIWFLPAVTSPGFEAAHQTATLSGGFAQAAWKHVCSSRSDTALQISVDRYKRNDILTEARNTLAIDFQHHILWGSRQDIVWGAAYGYTSSDSEGNLTVSFRPPNLVMQPFSGFAQDEFSLLPNRLYFTIGTKVDHNHYTGFSLMPSSRLSWTPNERNMFWAAVSRAERVPAESDAATRQNTGSVPGPGGLPILAAFVGNPHVKNEGLIAYEAGYRVAISTHLSADYALYYNDYDHQDSIEPLVPVLETTPSPPHVLAAATYKNLGYGETHGFEAAVNWKPSARWTLSPGYAFEQIHMHVQPSSKDTLSINEAQGASPVQSAQLRSHFEISHRLAWDASAYFVDRLSSGPVPSYTRLDTGLTWQLNQALSFSAFGQNLVKDRHLEFVDSSGILESTLVKRSMYGKLTWHF